MMSLLSFNLRNKLNPDLQVKGVKVDMTMGVDF